MNFSEGALVAEEASVLQLGALTRAADRQGAVLEVDGDLLLGDAGEVERVHELALGLPDVKRRCPDAERAAARAGDSNMVLISRSNSLFMAMFRSGSRKRTRVVMELSSYQLN